MTIMAADHQQLLQLAIENDDNDLIYLLLLNEPIPRGVTLVRSCMATVYLVDSDRLDELS